MKSNPAALVLGAYRLGESEDVFAEAMEVKYGGLELAPAERLEAERAVRDELAGVVLFEVLVQNPDEGFSVDDFGQPGSDQAPYEETYLSADGLGVIDAGGDVPEVEPLRICFYLHFVDVALPLRTSYGDVAIPALQPVPDRLRALVPYEPVE